MIILYILSAIVVLNILGFIINKILFTNELKKISPYGKLYTVKGRKMHVYSMGNGNKTLVLLPGLNVPLPSADFGPLMRELSKNFTVVCVEYFGIGFSDTARSPRTNENYTEEIRMALKLAGHKPPYVLIPHSASGIYSEYYAIKYPSEISEIVMLDTTSSAIKEPTIPKFVFLLSKLQQATGFSRIINAFVVPMLLKKRNGYTNKEIHDYGKFINHSLNDTIIDQNIRFKENVNELMRMDFPKEIRVLKIVPNGTIKQVGEKYQIEHLRKLGQQAKYIKVDGSHFIYQTQPKLICDYTIKFLNDTLR